MGLAEIAGKITGNKDEELSGEWDGDQADAPGGDDLRDPPPSRPDAGKSKTGPAPKVSQAKQKSIEREIADFLELLATGWSLRCQQCAEALDEARAAAAKNAATIICRNPRWVAWFEAEGFGTFMTWAGLGVALKPVAGALWEHRNGEHDHGGHDADAAEDFGSYVAPYIR